MMAMANMALVNPGPSTATMAIANNKKGNAITTSNVRMMTFATQPPA